MVDQAIRANLLAVADTYAKATALSTATVSRKFYGNQAFFDEYRIGKRSITTETVDELLRKFAKAWPTGLKWPAMRPVPMRRPPRS